MKASMFNIYIEGKSHCLIANTMRGGIAVCSKEDCLAIQSGNFESIQDLAEFIDEEYIINDSVDEGELLDYAYKLCRDDMSVINLVLAVTMKCNFRCPYCFESRTSEVMTIDMGMDIVRFLKKVITPETKIINVGWFGGEPLLYPELLCSLESQIRSFAKKRNLKIISSITTNGYYLTENIRRQLKATGISLLKVTFDGDEETHNKRRCLANGAPSYSRVYENVIGAANDGFQLLIRVNIDKNNMKAFQTVKNAFSSIPEATCYPAMVTSEEIQSDEQLKACIDFDEHQLFYETELARVGAFSLDEALNCRVRSCMAERRNSYVVGPDGSLYKCVNDIGNDKMSIGTLNRLKTESEAESKYLKRRPREEPECHSCVYYPICFGSCVYEYNKYSKHVCCASKYLLTQELLNALDREEEEIDEKAQESKGESN